MIRLDARSAVARAGAGLAAAIACGVSVAADGAAASDGDGAWVLLLLVATIGAAFIVLLQRQRRLANQLRDERIAAQGLAEQLDVWQWRSGVDHHIIHLRPPQGTPIADWPVPKPAALWEQFQSADVPALRACLEVHAPISDLNVSFASAGGVVSTCRMRGRALTDAEGRFSGYVGTLRVLATEAATAVPLAVAVPEGPPSEAPVDNERESFSYTVSHDLRAPIRVVEGFTKILKEDYGRLLDRIGNDHLDRVLGAAARMNSMIDALLALSRLSTQPLARQPVNLSQLAGWVADDLRRQSPERHVKLVIEPGLQVQGDPTLLRVVIENLLGNAWKYTGKCREAQIWFGRDPQQPGQAFTVRDNGAGFDMRFSDRLFGVFQRLHSATDFQGTGVGLASVRRIVRRHGGDIWAESEVDRGASFHFTLGTSSPTAPSP
jgi:signal transduction histidine kinase